MVTTQTLRDYIPFRNIFEKYDFSYMNGLKMLAQPFLDEINKIARLYYYLINNGELALHLATFL